MKSMGTIPRFFLSERYMKRLTNLQCVLSLIRVLMLFYNDKRPGKFHPGFLLILKFSEAQSLFVLKILSAAVCLVLYITWQT